MLMHPWLLREKNTSIKGLPSDRDNVFRSANSRNQL
jgi:hypothetical protein